MRDKAKQAAAKKRWQAARPHYQRALKYGLSQEAYDALFESQCGRCAICNALASESRYGTLFVDHDHATNKLRGLLCIRCNTGIGMLRDDLSIVGAAFDYLKKHNV